ncbi:MAG: Fe-S cluster assembly scaffold protein NifU [Syntrophomonadaceae bacterium]|nr:Fe-S cluster assembly scaffold protein NifU [Syntrophomonadaceae bacterium]
MAYSEKVMDHFMNPRNVGNVENASGVGEVGNPTCGDIMHIEIAVKDDKIEDIKFKTFGCAAAIATSSMVTEIVKGKTLEEAEKITNRTVAEALDGLPPVKMHCSNLAADALHEAIKNFRAGGPASSTVVKGCCKDETDSSCNQGMEINL